MSHAVKIKTQFTSIEVMKKAFARSGWTQFLENSKARMYAYDTAGSKTYDYVAVNPTGKFDIGLNFDDGTLSFIYDTYDSSLERQLGKNLKNVKQHYALHELKKFTEEEDLDCSVTELPNGMLKIVATK